MSDTPDKIYNMKKSKINTCKINMCYDSIQTENSSMQNDNMQSGSERLTSRRGFVKAGVGVAGFAAASAVLAACSNDMASNGATNISEQSNLDSNGATVNDSEAQGTTANSATPELTWEMATSWPAALTTMFGSAEFFAEKVGQLTEGRFKIKARAAGEIVGGLEVQPAVTSKTVPIGHTASYYYIGLSKVPQFSTGVPFGLTQRQQNAWLYHGGGLEMLNDFYAKNYGIITFPVGGTGCQMGGWYTKEINTVADLQGFTMRMPGIAGEVWERLGAQLEQLAAGEILQAIQTRAVDGAEFVGPSDDLTIGLGELKGELYYYYPGWWEPGATSDIHISLDYWNELPDLYKTAIEVAAMATNIHTVAHYDELNQTALQRVKKIAKLREFSPELMAAFKFETEKLLNDVASEDAKFAEILVSWRKFRDGIAEWHSLAERSYLSQQV